MDFVENIWVSQERAGAGLGAEVDHPAAVVGAREVRRVGIVKDPSAKGHKVGMRFLFRGRLLHPVHARGCSLHVLNFCDEYFERIDGQSFGRFGCL